MFNANFTMTDCATGTTITQNHYCEVPKWAKAGNTQLIRGHFARIQCLEYARQFFGTDDVTVRLNVVNGVEYAY